MNASIYQRRWLAGSCLLLCVTASQGQAPSPYARFIPGAPVVDAKSILKAVQVDAAIERAPRRAPCEPDEDEAAQPLAGNQIPADPYGMAKGSTPPKARGTRGCVESEDDRMLASKGLAVYQRLAHSPGLIYAANKAAGLGDAGVAATPAAGKSRSCVWSVYGVDGASFRWPRFDGVTTPVIEVLDGPIERSVSVVDLECFSASGTSVPANLMVLSVHEYLDKVIESRVDRARRSNYSPYAARFLREYVDLKKGLVP